MLNFHINCIFILAEYLNVHTTRNRRHLCTHSPIGEVFRSRLRQFPSFVNCCTIDWFSEWPDEALKSVAQNFIQEITEIDDPETIPGLVSNTNCIHYRKWLV